MHITSNKSKFFISLLLCQAAGILGTFFTSSAITEWYQYLNKPSLNPPNEIFGPVWVILYTLMAISLFLVWKRGLNTNFERNAFWFFIVHLVFNFAWTLLFFGLRNPLLGLIEIIILWVMILTCIVLFYRISRPAALLLVPYLLWVSFATVLNYSILQLN